MSDMADAMTLAMMSGHLGKSALFDVDFAKAEHRMMSYMGMPIRRVDKHFIHWADELPTASRYHPATSEDHDAMNDLTLHAAPKGGYTVQNYDDDVVFAGSLDDCLDHLREHFTALHLEARRKAEKEAAALVEKERQEKIEAEIARIRREGLD